jgi:hypothetical protein
MLKTLRYSNDFVNYTYLASLYGDTPLGDAYETKASFARCQVTNVIYDSRAWLWLLVVLMGVSTVNLVKMSVVALCNRIIRRIRQI